MKLIKKILVPTDFSEHAQCAYRFAGDIARRFDAKVDFIHVIPTLKYFNESFSRLEAPLEIMNKELYPTAQKEAKERMQKEMNEHLTNGIRGEAISRIDRTPSSTIVNLAKEDGYDLIVMASKGQHGSHLLRGSTTNKVIRHSEVPVFTVDQKLTSENLNRILLPTDGSEIAFSAFPLALTMAVIYEAEIVLYHVQELYGTPLEYESRNPNKSEKVNIYQALLYRLENFLMSDDFEHVKLNPGKVDFEDQCIITEGASSQTVNLYTVIDKGVSAHVGIEVFAPGHADIVVMATHGHSGLAHFFLGSTTEKVVQSLDMPVLTVKPAAEKLAKK